MSVSTERLDTVTVLRVSGRLDTEDTQGLEARTLEAIEAGTAHLLYDFEDLDYINSSGLRVLVMAWQRLRKQGGVVAVSGLRDYILEVFEISGYDKVFVLHATRREALKALGATA